MQKYEQTIVYCDLYELKVKVTNMKRGYVRLNLIRQAIGNLLIILHARYLPYKSRFDQFQYERSIPQLSRKRNVIL